jgi:hypothetical protein
VGNGSFRGWRLSVFGESQQRRTGGMGSRRVLIVGAAMGSVLAFQ